MLNGQHRLKQIDGLRGIAMLMIVCYHYIVWINHSYQLYQIQNYPLGLSHWGNVGIDIFWLLSGFFMIPDRETSFLQHMKRRLIKLWPPYFIAISIIFIVTNIFPLQNRTVGFAAYLLNIPFLNGLIERDYVDGALWYLPILITTTCIFTSLMKVSHKKRHIIYWLWLLAVVLLRHATSDTRLVRIGITVINNILGKQFVCLIIIGAVWHDIEKNGFELSSIGTLLLAIAACAWTNSFLYLISAIVAMIATVLALHDKLPMLEWKPFQWLGSVSYHTYLIHQNIGYLLILTLVSYFGQYHVAISLSIIPVALGMGVLLKETDKHLRVMIGRLFDYIAAV